MNKRFAVEGMPERVSHAKQILHLKENYEIGGNAKIFEVSIEAFRFVKVVSDCDLKRIFNNRASIN